MACEGCEVKWGLGTDIVVFAHPPRHWWNMPRARAACRANREPPVSNGALCYLPRPLGEECSSRPTWTMRDGEVRRDRRGRGEQKEEKRKGKRKKKGKKKKRDNEIYKTTKKPNKYRG